MNIAFDLDGVVLQQDEALLNLIHQLPNNDAKITAYKYYCKQRKINFNPAQFIGPGDRGYFITARGKQDNNYTKRWVNKFYPQFTLIPLSTYDVTEKWVRLHDAEAKKQAIINYKIDVYFEDVIEIVAYLRRHCSNCKIIHYEAT